MKNNKNTRLIVVLATVAALGAGGAGMYWLGMQRAMQASPAPAGAAPAPKEAGKKPLYWHDPMVPGQKFDKPGKSPFMDMQLVPVYANGDDGDAGSVSISPRVQQNLGVRTAEVTRGRLAPGFSAAGSVAYNERDLALVQARSNGFVEKLHVRATLDPVRKGQPLAELYVPDWVAAQEEYLTARQLQKRGLDGVADGARQRMRLAGMDEQQIRLVESSGKVHPRITLRAPVDGIVAELSAREGMAVLAGAPLFRINGIGTVWVNAEIPESLASRVRPGQPVEARTAALPGMIFKGKVGALLPQVDAATRTLTARIEVANPAGRLAPGMFATIDLAQQTGDDVLLVPSEALIRTGTRSIVMLAQGEGRFMPAEVETGAESQGQTEIRKGLVAGQKVVVSGQFLIDSEASLKGTTVRMGEPQAAAGKAAPSPAGTARHHAVGKVEHIGAADITLSHGPVATLRWDAMTMDFSMPPGVMPRNVKVGDMVSFDFVHNKDGDFEIVAMAPAPAGATP